MLKRTDSCPSSAQSGREKAAYTEQMRWGSVLTISYKQRRHAMDNFYPYPLTIVHDRYNGCYSGGEFTAWNLYPQDVPEEIDSDDVNCCVFF